LGIDQLIDQLLTEFDLQCLELPGETRDGWVGKVLEAMELPGEPPQMDLFS